MYLEKLGVFGWREADENLLLASLLTGDPLLLIGNHGAAKTHVGYKVAEALKVRFIAYDASKCMWEDLLGFPHVEKLKHGVVEYVASPVTIWDKELVLIDELNRAVPELQSKWLEIIRSRKVMGRATDVNWVWSAMNPVSYSATNALDDALIGRFALYLYPPTVLDMNEADRIRVAEHINGDDAPGLGRWVLGQGTKTVRTEDTEHTGAAIRSLLHLAGRHFVRLKDNLGSLAEFLAKFAALLVQESHGKLALDGRRLGFLYRNLLAARAIELAKAELCHQAVGDFADSARYVVQSSIPVGLNDEETNRENAIHQIEICFELLSAYFSEHGEIGLVNKIYELFTTRDVLRRAELLIAEDLGEFARSKAWTDLMSEERDLTVLAYTALQVEVRRPGTVPQELLASLSAKIDPNRLGTGCIESLKGRDIEYVEEVEELLKQRGDLGRLIAYQCVSELVAGGAITTQKIEETSRTIQRDIDRFESLVENRSLKGGKAA